MTPYEIPLSAQAQQFQIQLGGTTYTLKLVWNTMLQLWVLDILTGDLLPVVTGLPLQPGVDLLAQFKHLGIPGQLWVELDGDLNQAPGYADLGTSGHLYFVVP